ncbi:hypothetical protein [Streptococcus ruminantium]|uniref:Uncharacterized protein n=1 Tax=Streptococcus ruminantium TaxID=1917441 RepID=A0ABU1B1Q6_9STRE|nr:hypothetical protein [Streptococcus ruminantium]MDQ8760271.1 hypothetical protein [Streptococcus ruminantium]MDQ8765243.1 hypothetical protein [Streptococcus ruminantium]MDQ8767043.1 hypothetical protein [Streptococcus ruminantium]MDQ8769610.1 hypothetical protein [Streptococcus ruminantium]MDQ8775494.1 hypothetical protein [Streptococcus ruminantium]
MQILGELLLELLMELPDFDERKHPPFGVRYWLGWLGILFNVMCMVLIGFLVVYLFFDFLKRKELFTVTMAMVLLPVAIYWLWRTIRRMRKMWQVTVYYWKSKQEHQS